MLAFKAFNSAAVTGISFAWRAVLMFVVAEMLGQFCIERRFHRELEQLTGEFIQISFGLDVFRQLFG